ncbi:MAG: NAD-dependent dehydratase, partial [Nostoc sp.]
DERTCNDIAGILGAAIGKPYIKWVTFTDEQVQASMQKNGVPALLAAMLVEINASIRTGLIREDYDLHKPVMGKIKLEDFAKEFAASF